MRRVALRRPRRRTAGEQRAIGLAAGVGGLGEGGVGGGGRRGGGGLRVCVYIYNSVSFNLYGV